MTDYKGFDLSKLSKQHQVLLKRIMTRFEDDTDKSINPMYIYARGYNVNDEDFVARFIRNMYNIEGMTHKRINKLFIADDSQACWPACYVGQSIDIMPHDIFDFHWRVSLVLPYVINDSINNFMNSWKQQLYESTTAFNETVIFVPTNMFDHNKVKRFFDDLNKEVIAKTRKIAPRYIPKFLIIFV